MPSIRGSSQVFFAESAEKRRLGNLRHFAAAAAVSIRRESCYRAPADTMIGLDLAMAGSLWAAEDGRASAKRALSFLLSTTTLCKPGVRQGERAR
jgi:hypothetical protein